MRIKGSYPDAVVLFRLGDFYETFDDDAELAARELEITLTSRTMGKDTRVPMAGVPAHALESYLARLVKKGHKVAICEQLTDPAQSRGLVERDVVRVVTPGTVFESSLLDQDANNYLAALVEEGDQVGLAYVDITTGEFAATQLEVDKLLPELERIGPAEILIPAGDSLPQWIPQEMRAAIVNGGGSPVSEQYPIAQVNSAAFDMDLARDALLSHFRIHTLESFGCEGLPLVVKSCGAIVDYLSQTYKANAPRLSPLSLYSTANYMTLDAQTRRNLELFQAGRWENRKLSLLNALDMTRTPMGGRMLRRWLGQPLLELGALEQRLDSVEHFVDAGLSRARSREILSHVADLERILGRIQAGNAGPRDLIGLLSGLSAAGPLQDALEERDGKSVEFLRSRVAPISDPAILIEHAINAEPSGPVGEGGVIREGFSPELDEIRAGSRDARSFIASLEQRERERTGIRNLRVGYNQVFGYYLEVSKSNLDQVPEDYVRRQTLANGERYIVPELKEYESLILNARERMAELEKSLFRQVCAQVCGHAEAISRLSAAMAEVDVYCSLAEVAVRHHYVRPAVNQGDDVVIRNGRHPVVERHLGTGSFVPNDVQLSSKDARIVVLTGPNMAGKSTFIRQVGIIVLMAQIGSFVPADEASIGLVDRIFTRVGLQDDLTTGQSTFMVEMVETAAILNQATPRSLVILDEIGRGTSTFDGLSIARSVIEHLHNEPRLGCKCLFATHYHELTELARTLPGVRNFSVAVAENEGQVVFLHRIMPGGADRSYGVHVAQLAGLPRAVINRAWDVLADLEETGGPPVDSRKGKRRGAGLQIPLFQPEESLREALLGIDVSNLTPLQAINKLYELQEEARDQSGEGRT